MRQAAVPALVAIALVACGGQIELVREQDPGVTQGPRPMPGDEASPPFTATPQPTPPGTLEVIPTDLDDPLAGAICADVAMFRAEGTFTADPYFRVSDATSITADLDDYTVGGTGLSGHFMGITLVFHLPAERGEDMLHGAYLGESEHRFRLDLNAAYPGVPTGTFDRFSIIRQEHRSLCYADALGASADAPWDGSTIDGTKIVIASPSEGIIEGTITSEDGAHRLDFRAPIKPAGYPKEGPICCLGKALDPSAPPKLAPACVPKTSGSFTADPAFGLAAGTKLETYLDERYLDGGRRGVFLRLDLRSPSTTADDDYGESRHRHRTTFTFPLETPYPTIPPGSYRGSLSTQDREEACYPNGLGYQSLLPTATPSRDAKLTITSQTSTAIAGVIEVGSQRLAFDSPITPPAEEPRHPDCCRE